jgi:hypothetical protein
LFEIIFEISYVFSGFVLGVYFEKYNDSRKDSLWLEKALKSIRYDLTRDHELFEKTIKVDQKQIDDDLEIFNKINSDSSINDFFSYLDELNDNSGYDGHFGNLTGEDYDFIDLNRVNYDAFLKFGNKDGIEDNKLKGNLDWLFEGLTFLYRTEISELRNNIKSIDEFCARIGYSKEFKDPIENRYNSTFIKQFKAIYANYIKSRKRHILIKKQIIGMLTFLPNMIDDALKKI